MIVLPGLSDGLATVKGLGHGAFEEAKDFYDRVYEFCR